MYNLVRAVTAIYLTGFFGTLFYHLLLDDRFRNACEREPDEAPFGYRLIYAAYLWPSIAYHWARQYF